MGRVTPCPTHSATAPSIFPQTVDARQTTPQHYSQPLDTAPGTPYQESMDGEDEAHASADATPPAHPPPFRSGWATMRSMTPDGGVRYVSTSSPAIMSQDWTIDCSRTGPCASTSDTLHRLVLDREENDYLPRPPHGGQNVYCAYLVLRSTTTFH